MAMDDLLNEHEQSERVRSWVRSNALAILGGIGLGLGGIVGWQWWQQQQTQGDMAVSQNYAEAVRIMESGLLPADGGKAALASLGESNPTLATLAALQLARAQVDAGKRDEAVATLRNLRSVDPDLKPVVNQRLARLLLDAAKAKEALALLGADRTPATLAVRGDAQMALGDREKARADYLEALGQVDVADPQHRLLTLKLIEAGGKPPHSETNT